METAHEHSVKHQRPQRFVGLCGVETGDCLLLGYWYLRSFLFPVRSPSACSGSLVSGLWHLPICPFPVSVVSAYSFLVSLSREHDDIFVKQTTVFEIA